MKNDPRNTLLKDYLLLGSFLLLSALSASGQSTPRVPRPRSSPEVESADARPYDRRVALVVGVNSYENEDDLHYAVPDARDLAEILSRDLHFEVTLLLDEEARRDRIISKLVELGERLGQEDQFLFYFAGHGVASAFGDGESMRYLIPHEASKPLAASAIPMVQIEDLVVKLRAKHALIMIDACGVGLTASEFPNPELENEQHVTGISRPARQIITSARASQESRESPDLRHGHFTDKVLRGLRTRDADQNKSGIISATELASYVYDQSVRAKERQTPQFARLTPDPGEFLFIFSSPEPRIPKIAYLTPFEIAGNYSETALRKFKSMASEMVLRVDEASVQADFFSAEGLADEALLQGLPAMTGRPEDVRRLEEVRQRVGSDGLLVLWLEPRSQESSDRMVSLLYLPGRIWLDRSRVSVNFEYEVIRRDARGLSQDDVESSMESVLSHNVGRIDTAVLTPAELEDDTIVVLTEAGGAIRVGQVSFGDAITKTELTAGERQSIDDAVSAAIRGTVEESSQRFLHQDSSGRRSSTETFAAIWLSRPERARRAKIVDELMIPLNVDVLVTGTMTESEGSVVISPIVVSRRRKTMVKELRYSSREEVFSAGTPTQAPALTSKAYRDIESFVRETLSEERGQDTGSAGAAHR